eukprot:TRINITY_DN127_c2_g4_i1.p1 TRINITY_DN127_c2_g4~~TRINITY_DN127_c2_g4_i1.p1  ORF type:complete len:1659 (+),score=474.22 TRINITY_DN127_c2_g4_i1:126-4979(+)
MLPPVTQRAVRLALRDGGGSSGAADATGWLLGAVPAPLPSGGGCLAAICPPAAAAGSPQDGQVWTQLELYPAVPTGDRAAGATYGIRLAAAPGSIIQGSDPQGGWVLCSDPLHGGALGFRPPGPASCEAAFRPRRVSDGHFALALAGWTGEPGVGCEVGVGPSIGEGAEQPRALQLLSLVTTEAEGGCVLEPLPAGDSDGDSWRDPEPVVSPRPLEHYSLEELAAEGRRLRRRQCLRPLAHCGAPMADRMGGSVAPCAPEKAELLGAAVQRLWGAKALDVAAEITSNLRGGPGCGGPLSRLATLRAAAGRLADTCGADHEELRELGVLRVGLLAAKLGVSACADLDSLMGYTIPGADPTALLPAQQRQAIAAERYFDPSSNCWMGRSPYVVSRMAAAEIAGERVGGPSLPADRAEAAAGVWVKWAALMAALAQATGGAAGLQRSLLALEGIVGDEWQQRAAECREAAEEETTWYRSAICSPEPYEQWAALESGAEISLPSLGSVTLSLEAAVGAMCPGPYDPLARRPEGCVILALRGAPCVLRLWGASAHPHDAEGLLPFAQRFAVPAAPEVHELLFQQGNAQRKIRVLRVELEWRPSCIPQSFLADVLADARGAEARLAQEELSLGMQIGRCIALVRQRRAAMLDPELRRACLSVSSWRRAVRNESALRAVATAAHGLPPTPQVAWGDGRRRPVPALDPIGHITFGKLCEDIWRRKDGRVSNALDELADNLRCQPENTRRVKQELLALAANRWPEHCRAPLQHADTLGCKLFAGLLLRLYQRDGVQIDRIMLIPGAPRGACTEESSGGGSPGNPRRWREYEAANWDNPSSNVSLRLGAVLGEAARVASTEQYSGAIYHSRTAALAGLRQWIKCIAFLGAIAQETTTVPGAATQGLYAAGHDAEDPGGLYHPVVLDVHGGSGAEALQLLLHMRKGDTAASSAPIPVTADFAAAARVLGYPDAAGGALPHPNLLLVFSQVPRVVQLPLSSSSGSGLGLPLLVPFLSEFRVAQRPRQAVVDHPDRPGVRTTTLRIVFEYTGTQLSRDLSDLAIADARKAERTLREVTASMDALAADEEQRTAEVLGELHARPAPADRGPVVWHEPVHNVLVTATAARNELSVQLPDRPVLHCTAAALSPAGPLLTLPPRRRPPTAASPQQQQRAPPQQAPPLVLHLPTDDPSVIAELAAHADRAGVPHDLPKRLQLLRRVAAALEQAAAALARPSNAPEQQPAPGPRAPGLGHGTTRAAQATSLDSPHFLSPPPRGAPPVLQALLRQLPHAAADAICAKGAHDAAAEALSVLLDLHERLGQLPASDPHVHAPLAITRDAVCVALLSVRNLAGEGSMKELLTHLLLADTAVLFAQPALAARLTSLDLADVGELQRCALRVIDSSSTPLQVSRVAERFAALLSRFAELEAQRGVVTLLQAHAAALTVGIDPECAAAAAELADGALRGVCFSVEEGSPPTGVWGEAAAEAGGACVHVAERYPLTATWGALVRELPAEEGRLCIWRHRCGALFFAEWTPVEGSTAAAVLLRGARAVLLPVLAASGAQRPGEEAVQLAACNRGQLDELREAFTSRQLRGMCSREGLERSGSRDELIRRLRLHWERPPGTTGAHG